MRPPSCASRNAAAENAASTAWEAGLGRRQALWGPRCFSYESQGLGWGGCCGILIVALFLIPGKKRQTLSYDPDTRGPHWLAQ